MINPFNTLKVILHNKNYFSKPIKSKKIILVEFNRLSSSVISYTYLTNVLKRKYKANICAYRQTTKKNKLKDLIWYLASKINIFNTHHIYKSFGTDEFFLPNNLKMKRKNIDIKIKKIIKGIKSKQDLLNLKIDEIYVGDLFYDSYLMDYKKPTIDINSEEFKKFIHYSIENFFKWKEFFKIKKIQSVVVSHTVYTLAIPLRIAISKSIPAFQCSAEHIYKLSKKNIYAYRQFLDYKNFYKKIDDRVKLKLMKLAKYKLSQKFSGHNISHEFGSSRSPYENKYYKRILKKNNKIKVLIAPHCFFDNPHPYGKNLFVDMYEWLEFLGKISKKTNYDWYIKLHPDYLDGTKEVIDSFLDKYKNIKFIENNYSHNQLLKEGIDVALTCFGSIAHEYPLFNRLVINCSLNNPHINYNFSLHPKNKLEYQKILLNLKKINKPINKREVYEFYSMFTILKKSWLINDFKSLISRYGVKIIFDTRFYSYWTNEEFSLNKHNFILKSISDFLKTNDYLMNWNTKDVNNFFKKC